MSIWWLILKYECPEFKVLISKNANQLFHQAKNQKSLSLEVQSSKLQETCIFMQDYWFQNDFWDFFTFVAVFVDFRFSISGLWWSTILGKRTILNNSHKNEKVSKIIFESLILDKDTYFLQFWALNLKK